MKFWSIKTSKLILKTDWKVPPESQVRSLQSKWPFVALESFLLSRQGAGPHSSAVISLCCVLFLSMFLQPDFRMNTNLWLFILKNFFQVLKVGLVMSEQVHKPRVGCLGRSAGVMSLGISPWRLPPFPLPVSEDWLGARGGGAPTAQMLPVSFYRLPIKPPYKCKPKT